jgi:hypothetical protein
VFAGLGVADMPLQQFGLFVTRLLNGSWAKLRGNNIEESITQLPCPRVRIVSLFCSSGEGRELDKAREGWPIVSLEQQREY